MRAMYLLGGAGTGKSTFMAALMAELGVEFGPFEAIHAQPNKKNLVTLRGHRLTPGDGLYLGRMRESFPGTDGLDRVSGPVGEAWLDDPALPKPAWLVSEGRTLATRRFLHALNRAADLLIVESQCDPAVVAERCRQRGSNQDPQFIRMSVTASRNVAAEVGAAGARVLTFDSADTVAWDLTLDLAATHLTRKKEA